MSRNSDFELMKSTVKLTVKKNPGLTTVELITIVWEYLPHYGRQNLRKMAPTRAIRRLETSGHILRIKENGISRWVWNDHR